MPKEPKEIIVFAITEELIESEAEPTIGRELTQEELDEVVSEIESESTPIFEFIRECIAKVTGEDTRNYHEGHLI